MPHRADPGEVRSILAADRAWSVYALGDLAPGFSDHSEWHTTTTPGQTALLLLYRAFATPVMFTLGPAPAVAALIEEIAAEPALYLSIRPEILPLVKARYNVSHEAAMWRMVLDPASFQLPPVASPPAVRLGRSDLPALRALFADGTDRGETPDFFEASMLEQGVFFGLYEGTALVAAAGTHLAAPSEGVAAVGNVYTRHDCRGRGLAARVTGAVTAELLRQSPPLEVIALNVNQANVPALTVYERLGYRRYCAFYEGLAEKPHA